MGMGMSIVSDRTVGRVLTIRCPELDLSWSCWIDHPHIYHKFSELSTAIDALFDEHECRICLCSSGVLNVRDADSQQVIHNVAGLAWMDCDDSVREYRVMPLFDCKDNPEAFHAPAVTSQLANIAGKLVYEFPALDLGCRPFVFLHEGRDGTGGHFHVLMIDDVS